MSNTHSLLSICLTACLSLLTVSTSANANEQNKNLTEKPAEVMMFGTFHFNNPGLDVVKNPVIDVTTPKNQKYLAEFSTTIATDFEPTHVLIECPPSSQETMNQRYDSYLAGEYELPVNETYQLGFRIAKQAKAQQVVCFDERNTPWKAGPLMTAMPQDAPKIQNGFEKMIATLSSDTSKMHKTMSLKEILAFHNTLDADVANKSLYLFTNTVGAGDSFVGADASASWWHRNFRMYANIQKVAKANTRLFVIAGQGHTAVLKDFVKYDKAVVGKDVDVYF